MTTAKLAAFTAAMTYDDLPASAVFMAKQCVLDWLGVAIRGSKEQPAVLLRQTVLRSGGSEATVFGADLKAAALDAALVNGAASHTLDFDDLHNPSIIHLATVVVPAAFAVAEDCHKSGRDLLTAVCAGYEAGARAGEAIIPESYFYWHTTGTAGIFGSAAAAANLLKLDAWRTLMCYGSAGTQAAGLWEFLAEGAMSKALHAGKAAYGGVLAAYLAQAGFTGASKILEGEKGFCRALSAAPHLEKLTEKLDYHDLKIQHNSFKPYACCKHSHAAVFGALTLRRREKLRVENIEKITLRVNKITDFLINDPQPKNVYGCKFSIQYCVAAALAYGALGIEQFTDEAIGDAGVRSLMARTEVKLDAEIEAVHQQCPDKLASAVSIELKDGRRFALQVDYPKGDPDNPMTWEESKAKFMNLAAPVYGGEKAGKLCAFIENIELCGDVAAGLNDCLREE